MHPRSLQSLRNGVKVAETLKPLIGTDSLLAAIVGLKWAAVGKQARVGLNRLSNPRAIAR